MEVVRIRSEPEYIWGIHRRCTVLDQDKIQEIALRFKDMPGGLLEALHAVQAECAYIPEDALQQLAAAYRIPLAKAYGVAKFYSYFSVQPRGRFIIRVCKSAPCHVQGARAVMQALEAELGIAFGETTKDSRFTLETTECVGACDRTPVITINGQPYRDLNPEKVKSILDNYKLQ